MNLKGPGGSAGGDGRGFETPQGQSLGACTAIFSDAELFGGIGAREGKIQKIDTGDSGNGGDAAAHRRRRVIESCGNDPHGAGIAFSKYLNLGARESSEIYYTRSIGCKLTGHPNILEHLATHTRLGNGF